MGEKKEKAGVRIKFVFNVCNDVAAIREFYVTLLGLEEVHFMDTKEWGWLATNSDGFQMMWFRAEELQDVPTEFACQPGWAGGVREVTSWGIEIPEADFRGVLESLAAAGAPMFKPEPDWRQDSYWGLSVLDPMGVTVEVYTMPAERPESMEWPGA